MAHTITPIGPTGRRAYKPGDPAPMNYLPWHEWAAVQYRAGLGQRQCSRCGKYKFPSEVDEPASASAGRVVCNDCAWDGEGRE